MKIGHSRSNFSFWQVRNTRKKCSRGLKKQTLGTSSAHKHNSDLAHWLQSPDIQADAECTIYSDTIITEKTWLMTFIKLLQNFQDARANWVHCNQMEEISEFFDSFWSSIIYFFWYVIQNLSYAFTWSVVNWALSDVRALHFNFRSVYLLKTAKFTYARCKNRQRI